MVNTIGHRETEYALQVGAMFSCEQAIKIGLVDELSELKDMTTVCHKHALNWANIPGTFFYIIKLTYFINRLLLQYNINLYYRFSSYMSICKVNSFDSNLYFFRRSKDKD